MSTRKTKLPPKPTGRPDRLFVSQLLLDHKNPRLAAEENPHSQDELVRFLWNEMAVDEIAFSIAKNSFFEEERIFVIPQKASEPYSDSKKYVVVEGNRRLAAVKILRDEKLRQNLGATELPSLSKVERDAIEKLPVSIYTSRQELWQYFGFKHINGPKPWDPYSKAVYVAEVHEKDRIPLAEIADAIGDRHSTVFRLYRGLKLLVQAESQGVWDREDRATQKLSFSHLYTAAAQPEFQKFLGLFDRDSLKPNPVPAKNRAQLQELMVWLYGSKSKGKAPVVASQMPDLNRLRTVLANKKGLDALRAGYALERAYTISIGDQLRFREALTRAKEELQQAKATVTTGYKGETDLIETTSEILEYAQSIQLEMKLKRRVRR